MNMRVAKPNKPGYWRERYCKQLPSRWWGFPTDSTRSTPLMNYSIKYVNKLGSTAEYKNRDLRYLVVDQPRNKSQGRIKVQGFYTVIVN